MAERFICQAKVLTTQQEAGLNTCLPLGINQLKVERLLNTRAAALFFHHSLLKNCGRMTVCIMA